MNINFLHRSAIISILSSFMLHAMESNEDIKKQQQQMSIKKEDIKIEEKEEYIDEENASDNNTKKLTEDQKNILDHLIIEYYPYLKQANQKNNKNNLRSNIKTLFVNKYGINRYYVGKFIHNTFILKPSVTYTQSRIEHIIETYNKHKESQNLLDQCATAYKNDNKLNRHELISLLYSLKEKGKITLFKNDVTEEFKKEIDPILSQNKYEQVNVPNIKIIKDDAIKQFSENELKEFFQENIDVITSSEKWRTEIVSKLHEVYGIFDQNSVLRILSNRRQKHLKQNGIPIENSKKYLFLEKEYTFFLFCLKNINDVKLGAGKNHPICESFTQSFKHWFPKLSIEQVKTKIGTRLINAKLDIAKFKINHEKSLSKELRDGILKIWLSCSEKDDFASKMTDFMMSYNKENQTKFPITRKHFFLFVLDQAMLNQTEEQLLEHSTCLDKKYEYLFNKMGPAVKKEKGTDYTPVKKEEGTDYPPVKKEEGTEYTPWQIKMEQVQKEAPQIEKEIMVNEEEDDEDLLPNLTLQRHNTSELEVESSSDSEKDSDNDSLRAIIPQVIERVSDSDESESQRSSSVNSSKKTSLNTKRTHKKVASSLEGSDDENFEQKTGRKQVKTNNQNEKNSIF